MATNILKSKFIKELVSAISLVILGVIAGLVLNLSFSINEVEAVRVSFAELPVLLGGILLGPWWGAFIGGAWDLSRFALQTPGTYVPGITLIAVLRGMLPGLLARLTGGSRRLQDLIIQVAVPQLLCSVFLTALALYQAFGIPILVNIMARFLVQTFTIPVYILIIYFIVKHWASTEALRESEEKYRAIYESVRDALLVFDREGVIVEANPAACSQYGYQREELLGLPGRRLIHPDCHDLFSRFMEAVPGKGFFEAEAVDVRRDGTPFPVEVKGTSILFRGTEHRMSVVRDISHLKHAEAVLEYQLQLEKIMTQVSATFVSLPWEKISLGINYALELTGNFFQVDRSYLFQVSPDGKKASNTHEWCKPGIQPQINNLQDITLDAFPWWIEKLEKYEVINIPRVAGLSPEAAAEKASLQEQSIQSALVVPLVSVDNIIGYMGFDSVQEERAWSEEHVSLLRVVAEIIASALVKERAEEALQESERRFRQMAENIGEVFWLVSADTRTLLYVNAAYEDVWGLSRQELYQDFVPALLGSILKEDRGAFASALEGLQEGKTFDQEYRIRRPDGDLSWVYTRFFNVYDDDHEIVGHAGISVDITRLKSSQEEALQASRAKSDFLAIVSHELRTPLHAILSFADLGLEESQDAGNQGLEDYFQKIQASSDRLLYLVNDLLDISQIEAGSVEYLFQETDIYKLALSSQAGLFTLLESKEIGLEVIQPGFTPLVNVDRERMMQVLRNLLHNAVKFSPRGSLIRVTFSRDGEPVPPRLSVHITDQGTGIPVEELEDIFDKFKQSGKAMYKKEGTGLGLAICREIIQAHGGKIYAENEPHKGARFTFTLPLHGEENKNQEGEEGETKQNLNSGR